MLSAGNRFSPHLQHLPQSHDRRLAIVSAHSQAEIPPTPLFRTLGRPRFIGRVDLGLAAGSLRSGRPRERTLRDHQDCAAPGVRGGFGAGVPREDIEIDLDAGVVGDVDQALRSTPRRVRAAMSNAFCAQMVALMMRTSSVGSLGREKLGPESLRAKA